MHLVFEQTHLRNYRCRVAQAVVNRLRYDYSADARSATDSMLHPSHVPRELPHGVIRSPCTLQLKHDELTSIIPAFPPS